MTPTPKSSLVTLANPRSSAAEAFRTLRTNLMFSGMEKPLHTLLVTSVAQDVEPQAGKSVTVANLAVSMAQGGRRTILVDCDLRRPFLHTLFSLPNERGLTTLLLEGDLNRLPLAGVAGVENLAVLPSGPLPPSPADLLISRRMEEVIAALKSRADVVLFDAPPVTAVTDAALLASKLDGVLLVVNSGRTRRDDAQRAKELLEKIHVRLVGAVLTNAPSSHRNGYYG